MTTRVRLSRIREAILECFEAFRCKGTREWCLQVYVMPDIAVTDSEEDIPPVTLTTPVVKLTRQQYLDFNLHRELERAVREIRAGGAVVIDDSVPDFLLFNDSYNP